MIEGITEPILKKYFLGLTYADLDNVVTDLPEDCDVTRLVNKRMTAMEMNDLWLASLGVMTFNGEIDQEVYDKLLALHALVSRALIEKRQSNDN